MAICLQGERIFLMFSCVIWKFIVLVYPEVFFFFFCQALAVVDYLISNGSERAVDEIIEHTYQLSVSIFFFIDMQFSHARDCVFFFY